MAEPVAGHVGGNGLLVTVTVSPAAGDTQEWALSLLPGACIADALAACGVTLAVDAVCGVWGRVRDPTHPLQAGDRVEVYRPLLVDPKVARRERFAKQGARTTGLFAKRREGAKAGY